MYEIHELSFHPSSLSRFFPAILRFIMNAWWTEYLPDIIRKRLEDRRQLQKIIGNTGWQFADILFRMGAGFIVSIWVTRYLGPERYGLLNYAIAFVALFSPIASLGLEDIVVRNIARDPLCKDITLGSAFFLKLAGGAVSFISAVAVIVLLRRNDPQMQWLTGIIAGGAILQTATVIECWFNSQVQSRYRVIARNIAFAISSLLKIFLISLDAPLIAFAWVGIIEVGIYSLGLVATYRWAGNFIGNWHITLAKAGSLFKDSWPLALSIIAMTVYQRIDQIMLGEMVGNKAVGVYSVAVRLSEVWGFIPTALYWSVYPAIVKAKSKSDEAFYSQLQKFYNLMALWSYTVALPITLIGPWLVTKVYGKAFSGAGSVLIVLIWATLFSNLELARSAFLATMNWSKAYLVTVTLGAVLNIALNFVLIPRYDVLGAAVASFVSYWFAVHGACFLFRPLRRTGGMITKAMLYPKIW